MLPLLLAAALAVEAPGPAAAPPAEEAEGVKWSASLGLGHAWGFLGVRGEARVGRWALGVGVSPLPYSVETMGGTNPDGTFFSVGHVALELGVAVGARWYSRVAPWLDWFVGAHVDAHPLSLSYFAAVTLGMRLRHKHLFVELAIGPAVGLVYLGDRGDRLPPAWVFGFGALGPASSTGAPGWLPDIGLAAGWAF